MCQVTTEEERVKFTEQLSDAEDWLYGDGETADAAEFKDKLKVLEGVGSPIATRASELELRAEVSCTCIWLLSSQRNCTSFLELTLRHTRRRQE